MQVTPMDDTQKIKNLLLGIFLILAFGAVYFARDMLLPIVIGLLVALTLSPIVRALARAGLPAPFTAPVIILGITLTSVMGVYALSGPATEIVDLAPKVSAALRDKMSTVLDSLEAVQDASDQVEDLTSGGNAAPAVSVKQPSLLVFAAGSVASFLSLGLVGLILAMFILASGDLFYFKLVNALGNTWTGHSNLLCELPNCHSAIADQCGNYSSISCINWPGYIAASIHISPLAG